jgi:hypothetical protein
MQRQQFKQPPTALPCAWETTRICTVSDIARDHPFKALFLSNMQPHPASPENKLVP